LLATRTLTRSLGMRGQDALVRAYGVREIVTGIGLLTASDPAPWLWGRVAGDALDLATLTMVPAESRKHRNVGIALANVAAVTAVDVLCAKQLSAPRRRQWAATRDYPNRPGLSGVEGSGSVAESATPAPGESQSGAGSSVNPTR